MIKYHLNSIFLKKSLQNFTDFGVLGAISYIFYVFLARKWRIKENKDKMVLNLGILNTRKVGSDKHYYPFWDQAMLFLKEFAEKKVQMS